jgi:hypothetical protein
MLHAISDFDIAGHLYLKIPIQSVEWAIEVVEAQWFNSKSMYMTSASQNITESMANRVLEQIEKHPWISLRDLAKKCRFLRSKQVKEIVEDLISTQEIKAITHSTNSTNPDVKNQVLLALINEEIVKNQ